MTTVSSVRDNVQSIAAEWRGQRSARQPRTNLEQADFDALHDAGFLLAAYRSRWVACGPTCVRRRGWCASCCARWRRPIPLSPSYRRCTRRSSATGCATPIHHSRIGRRNAKRCSPARQPGEQWGTITSEPGSGGDIAAPRRRPCRTATPFMVGRSYGVSGDKHFGSGSGIADRMITTAIPDGRGRAGDLRARLHGSPLGRIERLDAARRVGRRRHGGHPEPRDAPRPTHPRFGWRTKDR